MHAFIFYNVKFEISQWSTAWNGLKWLPMLKWLKSMSKNVNIWNTNYFSIDKWGFTQDDGTKRWKVIQKYTLYFWGCIYLFPISKRKMYVHCKSFSNTFSTPNQKRKTGAIKQNSLESVVPPRWIQTLWSFLRHRYITHDSRRVSTSHRFVVLKRFSSPIALCTWTKRRCLTAAKLPRFENIWVRDEQVLDQFAQARAGDEWLLWTRTHSFQRNTHKKHKFNMHLLYIYIYVGFIGVIHVL